MKSFELQHEDGTTRQNHFGITIVHVLQDTCDSVEAQNFSSHPHIMTNVIYLYKCIIWKAMCFTETLKIVGLLLTLIYKKMKVYK